MSDSTSHPLPDRRRFLKLIGLAAATGAVAGTGPALAQVAKPRRPGAQPKPEPGSQADISPEARDLAKIVKRRYGQHLDREQFEAVTQEIEFRVRAGMQLREAKLANHDEPDFIFHA